MHLPGRRNEDVSFSYSNAKPSAPKGQASRALYKKARSSSSIADSKTYNRGILFRFPCSNMRPPVRDGTHRMALPVPPRRASRILCYFNALQRILPSSQRELGVWRATAKGMPAGVSRPVSIRKCLRRVCKRSPADQRSGNPCDYTSQNLLAGMRTLESRSSAPTSGGSSEENGGSGQLRLSLPCC